MAKEIAEEYASSLADLTVNSKPFINMLTILAEENIAHAGVIVETVEKHLEKVHPDIKLPVLYLVDSIIKNVGGAYTQKFSQSIVNMFTRTFKQVDEKVRSQMFKLRETWHDVFPATKLYQLDVKVNLIDPAWPIQAQPQQPNIHVNPNFLKKNTPTTSVPPVLTEEEEKMRSLLAKKEQELLMLQRKKIEIELEQTKRQLELAEKNAKKVLPAGMPVAMVNPVVPELVAPPVSVPVKQRLGPPVNKAGGRIAPVSGALAAARRDPRLARHAPPAPAAAPAPAPASAPGTATAPAIAPNVFDIKPLERHVTKRLNVITVDVRQDGQPQPQPQPAEGRPPRDPRRRDPRVARRPRPEPDKKISDLPPIPKIKRAPEPELPPQANTAKPKKSQDKKKKRENNKDAKDTDSSPEKKVRKEKKEKDAKETPKRDEDAPVFKELRNFHKQRYRRGRASASPTERPERSERSERPERPECTQHTEHTERAEPSVANGPEIVTESKDVDLRVLQPVVGEAKPAPISQKRPSSELLDIKPKKTKLDKFDVLFGNEDVDLRQLPQVEEVVPPPPPILSESPKPDMKPKIEEPVSPPQASPKKDWEEEVKEKSDEKKKSISIIMQQAKEQFDDGRLDKNQYNALMYQVLLLNEKLKLKEAKQRESFEASRRKLKAHIQEENQKVSPKSLNTFGDIDERITPLPVFMDTPLEGQPKKSQDSDMRMNSMPPLDSIDGPGSVMPMPMPPAMPIFGPFNPAWRGPRPRMDDFGSRRLRAPIPPFFRKFDKRVGPWPPFEPPRPIIPPLPTPKLGTCQGVSPLVPYERTSSPPPLGAPNVLIPPTDIRILEYIDQDPCKTIQIDGVPREIRFYDDTAVIMLGWDDPREIKFLPGCRRVTFDNKDSVVLSFNEGYKPVEIDDQVFEIKFGAPTRELFINGRWFECFFGDQPLGVIIDGKPRLVHLEGPLPQVDIGKEKRTDLVAGKINLIVDAVNMYPLYLDAKVQKFHVNGTFFTIRFVDCLRTVLINEQPFKVEFGDLPKPLYVGNRKHFIRFSALPRYVKPGHVKILNMEGSPLPTVAPPVLKFENIHDQSSLDSGVESNPVQTKSPSPEPNSESGLNMLASVMPSSEVSAPSSASEYSSATPLFVQPEKIPGLETPADEKPANPILPILGNINVNDLFAKLVATGIVKVPAEPKNEPKEEPKSEEVKQKAKEDKNVIHKVDLLKPETLRIAQPGVVARLYGGMQCSGCGARFPPEHTVRYSQHLDWHFRQNRRDRDSARRAHSRRWHYDLPDWLQYEEVEDLDDREKNWFETGALEEGSVPSEAERESDAPSVAASAPLTHHCALCGDAFHQFYNEDKEEWHLRNSVRHDGCNYHPACYDDYVNSLNKEEPKVEEAEVAQEVETIEEEAIEIKDADDEVNSQSDNESVVEVVEPELPEPEPVEIDEGDEDDVIYKAEPVEEVIVEDECDTDDETTAARKERDEQAAIDFAKVKIKQEPVDPDDEPMVSSEPVTVSLDDTIVDEPATRGVVSSIDGNVQLDAAPAIPMPVMNNIRINIATVPTTIPSSTPLPVITNSPIEDDDNNEPLPPGEEPELNFTLKPALEGRRLRKEPPVRKGTELSGLCSIM